MKQVLHVDNQEFQDGSARCGGEQHGLPWFGPGSNRVERVWHFLDLRKDAGKDLKAQASRGGADNGKFPGGGECVS